MFENTMDRKVSDEIFKELDQDESGSVNFQEFVNMVSALACAIDEMLPKN